MAVADGERFLSELWTDRQTRDYALQFIGTLVRRRNRDKKFHVFTGNTNGARACS